MGGKLSTDSVVLLLPAAYAYPELRAISSSHMLRNAGLAPLACTWKLAGAGTSEL